MPTRLSFLIQCFLLGWLRFLLRWLHNIDLDLNFVFSVYDIKVAKEKSNNTVFLHPKKNVYLSIRLSTLDIVWEDEVRGLYAIRGSWPLLWWLLNNYSFLKYIWKEHPQAYSFPILSLFVSLSLKSLAHHTSIKHNIQ